MGKESIEWYNANNMIGFTADRDKYAGNGYVVFNEKTGENEAWWHQPGFKFGYPGAIPVEEVTTHLFNWEPMEVPITLRVPCDEADSDGQDGSGAYYRLVPDLKRKAIMRPDNDAIFGYFGVDSYKVHKPVEWLIDGPGKIAGDVLGIGTAGLQRLGGQAYVTLELPEHVKCEAGLDFKTMILASTSFDGTLATRYDIVTMAAVCDNSLSAAMKGAKATYKVKHSSKSLDRINDAQAALGLIAQGTEEMAAFLDEMVKVDVNDRQFQQIISQIVPIPKKVEVAGPKGTVVKNQRAITIAAGKQVALQDLWTRDPRASQWNGTLLGAYQAFNTWNEHIRPTNENGVERVMAGTLTGSFAKDDAEFFGIVGDLGIYVPTVGAASN